MNLTFRISADMARAIRTDLGRPHPVAAERVGFVFTRLAQASGGDLILACDYEPVRDDDYVDDPSVGARINSTAIRRVMQRVLSTGEGAFHVHMHEHRGLPGFSPVDNDELFPLMASVRNAAPASAHGVLLLSEDLAYGEALTPQHNRFRAISKVAIIGFPLRLITNLPRSHEKTDRFSRQSFLGKFASEKIEACQIGLVGVGGGGSHIAQQLAHVGFSRFTMFDDDAVEISNLNRLVGATYEDAAKRRLKVEVVARMIRSIAPAAEVECVSLRWQEQPTQLRGCDLIFGCVDSFAERRDLEIAARRFLIPYIDIGLDVNQFGDEAPRMAGQVILSMPGHWCMSCIGFLTAEKLRREAEKYGAAGPRAQVVWANGVLASTAVGIAVDLITDWTKSLAKPVYLSYDSNLARVQPHPRLNHLGEARCEHFPSDAVGEPRFSPANI